MADNKDKDEGKVEDKKTTGPKTEDSERKGDVESVALQEGANRALQDARQNQFGDITSSTGGANNPGQHGRDGGEINGQTNNPAPSEDVISGERANDTNEEPGPLPEPAEVPTTAEAPVKKL